ncbi:MAG: FlgO family outer membrane protein [Candidatus Bipolaricaulia bacterium]
MRKPAVLAVIALFLLTGCTPLIREPTAPLPKQRVAVMDFEDLGEGGLAGTVTETLITSFVKAGSFEIVERSQLEKAIEELKLGAAGILTEASAKEIGQAIGADAIVVGSVSTLREELLINTRIIDVETGVILVAETRQIPKTLTAIRRVTDTIVDDLTDAFAEKLREEPAPITAAETGIREPDALTQQERTPFAGIWRGSDPFDGSMMTLRLTQQGNRLEGVYEDAFSQADPDGPKIAPGFRGLGSGATLSPTEGRMTFDLERSDGATLRLEVRLVLSESNQVLTLTDPIVNDSPVEDPQAIGFPWMLRQK